MVKFVLHDVSEFPFVYVRLKQAPAGYAARWVEEMTALLAKQAQFVLISTSAADEEAHEDRKTRTQWLKANKRAFATWCAGVVSVEPDSARRAPRSEQAASLSQAFGLRMAVCASTAEAEAVARECLAQQREQ